MTYFRGSKGLEKLLSYFGAKRTKVAKRYTGRVTTETPRGPAIRKYTAFAGYFLLPKVLVQNTYIDKYIYLCII